MNSIMSYGYLLCFFLFLSLIIFLSSYLDVLILLEFLVLNLYMLIVVTMFSESFYCFCVYFLIVVVCEGSFGISVFISMIRLGGNNHLSLKNFCLC